MSDLCDRAAHSPGDTEDRDGFAGRQLRRFHRPVPADHEVDPDGGGFVEAEPFGFANQRLDRYRHQLGVRPVTGEPGVSAGAPHRSALAIRLVR